jgi:choline dehydrogenase-like flavoprotein
MLSYKGQLFLLHFLHKKPFDWIRGYQVGGKSLTWGRASNRWSDNEFKAPARLGCGISWPIGKDENDELMIQDFHGESQKMMEAPAVKT